MKDKMKQTCKVLGYCRVSTDNQKEEGTIELQEEAIKEYAQNKGFEIVEVFSDEGVSGAKELENRPGLSKLFDCLECNGEISGVLILRLDRFARDLYIQEHLIKKLESLEKKLFSVKEPDLDSNDPMRKAFRQFMGIVSELEKSFITMRLSGGRINKARKGGYAGGSTALGYETKDKELIINKEQSNIVKAIFNMKRYEKMSLRLIARELNDKGIKTARGGKWYAGTIKYILSNPIYRGILNYSNQRAKRTDLALL